MQAPAPAVGSTHRSFVTTDPIAAHDYVARTFARHEMTLTESDAVRFRLDSALTPDVTVGRMAYGTGARIVGPAMRDCYHVNLLVSGRCTVEQAGRRADFSAERNQSGVVFGPDQPVFIDWSGDCAQYHLKLSRRTFEEHAARLAGHSTVSPIDFDLTFPLDNPAGQSLCSAVAFYYSQLSRDGGLVTMRAVQRELESALMTQVLLVARSDLTATLIRSGGVASDHRIRELMEYVRDHPQDDLSVARLAELSGVTARTLQSGFRREAGMSPSEYVRAVRLGRAREELLAGTGGTVSDVANRWHFFHLGRFAQQYRARYGEAPSQTVRSVARQEGHRPPRRGAVCLSD